MYNLQNKVLVVVGGANGIGYKICDEYLAEGITTAVIVDIDEAQGKKSMRSLVDKYGPDKAFFVKANITTDLERVCKHLVEIYNRIDVLVITAGRDDLVAPANIVNLNISAPIEWSFKFVEIMSNECGGSGGTIILMSLIFGFRTIPFAPVYQATKFAVIGFVKSMGHIHNFEKSGVRFLALCPGFTESKQTLPFLNSKAKETIPSDFVDFARSHIWQDAEAVGQAAVEMFQQAKSGTVWLIEGAKPIEEVL